MSRHPDYPIRPPAELKLLTPVYDLACSVLGLGRRFKRRLVDLAEVPADARILDLGCGTGVLLDELLSVHPSVTADGVDPDAGSRRIAQKRLARHGERVTLHDTRAESLPFADGRFDVAFSSLVMHHVPDEFKARFLAELRRTLSRSGTLVFADYDTSRRWQSRERSVRTLPEWLSSAELHAQHVQRHRGVDVFLARPV